VPRPPSRGSEHERERRFSDGLPELFARAGRLMNERLFACFLACFSPVTTVIDPIPMPLARRLLGRKPVAVVLELCMYA